MISKHHSNQNEQIKKCDEDIRRIKSQIRRLEHALLQLEVDMYKLEYEEDDNSSLQVHKKK